MQWRLAEEQQDYQSALRAWLADAAPSDQLRAWAEDDPHGSEFEARMRWDGMAGVGVAESLGGQGGGVVELALTSQELGRAAVPSGAWLATALAMVALDGAPELASEALAGGGASLLVRGDAVPDQAPMAITCTGDRLHGTVEWVLGSATADLLVAPVAAADGLRLRAVRRSDPGVVVRPHHLLDRSRSAATVVLEGAASRPLPTDGGTAMRKVADRAGVLVAADALGAMERMLEMTVSYSLQRHQFGVQIGSFQAVKHAAATILVDVEAGRSGLYYAAASVESDNAECSLHASAIKAQITAAAGRAADSALTMHGAIGYTWEHDLQLFYKRARLDEALFGPPSAWNERLAQGLPLLKEST